MKRNGLVASIPSFQNFQRAWMRYLLKQLIIPYYLIPIVNCEPSNQGATASSRKKIVFAAALELFDRIFRLCTSMMYFNRQHLVYVCGFCALQLQSNGGRRSNPLEFTKPMMHSLSICIRQRNAKLILSILVDADGFCSFDILFYRRSFRNLLLAVASLTTRPEGFECAA